MPSEVLDLGTPQPKQVEFLTDTHNVVAFGGARGGGKSWVVDCKAKVMSYACPGITQIIVRKTYPELTENHIVPLTRALQCYHPDRHRRLAVYNDSKKTITFPNGSRILFRYLEREKDLGRFQGTECDIMYLDEATQFTEDMFKTLWACVRGTNSHPKRMYLTCNPGGVGHQWVKRLFIDRVYDENENPEDYSFIQSLVTDNQILLENSPKYLQQLDALPAKVRQAWRYGDWNVFSGQFFEEWRNNPDHYTDRRWTHVIDPFDIPADWKVYRSFDWGYSKPFSCGWWAQGYDGVVYRIKEWYGCTSPNDGLKLPADIVFQKIREIETHDPLLAGRHITGVADPAIFAKDDGYSIAETANRHGVYFERGDNTRIAGWMQCHYRLMFDERGYPMMYVFKNCKDFIRTIPLMMYDEHKVEDLNTELEDHAMDEFRYFSMLQKIPPRRKIPSRALADDPLDQMKKGY